MKKTLIALALAAASLLPRAAKAEDTKPKFDLWAESYSSVDRNEPRNNLWTPRIHLSKDKDDFFFRAEYTKSHDLESVRLGSRVDANLANAVKGQVGFYGNSDSNENYGIGVEFDGDIVDFLKVSGSLERTNTKQLEHITVGTDLPLNITAKLGYFNNDGTSNLHGTAWTSLDDQFFLGIGGRIDENKKGIINMCFGRYFAKKGEGLGWRLWGQYDFDGNWSVDGIMTLGNNFSQPSFTALMGIYKAGINDPKIVNSIADTRAPSPYVRGSTVLRFNAAKKKGQNAKYIAELHQNFGNIGPVTDMRAGGRWYHEDVSNAKDLFQAVFSAGIGPLCAEYVLNLKQGKKPVHEIWVGTSLNDCIDYAKKQLE